MKLNIFFISYLKNNKKILDLLNNGNLVKPTDKNLAEFFSLSRQTVASYRKSKDKYNLYLAMVEYYIHQ